MNNLFFSVDGIPCALPLSRVRIVIRMVQPEPARETRPGLCGTLDFHGQIIPVWSVRSFFGRPDRPPGLTDLLIVVERGQEHAALWVDETHVARQSPLASAETEKPKVRRPLSAGVDLVEDGTVLFADIFRFLAQEPLPVISGIAASPRPHREDGR